MKRTYTVVLKKEPTGGYSVSVPALPGCFTDGDTVAHALEMIRDAIEGYLEVMAEDGEPAPRDKMGFYLSLNGHKAAIIRQVTVPVPEAVSVA
jgi:antitoxin HicB